MASAGCYRYLAGGARGGECRTLQLLIRVQRIEDITTLVKKYPDLLLDKTPQLIIEEWGGDPGFVHNVVFEIFIGADFSKALSKRKGYADNLMSNKELAERIKNLFDYGLYCFFLNSQTAYLFEKKGEVGPVVDISSLGEVNIRNMWGYGKGLSKNKCRNHL